MHTCARDRLGSGDDSLFHLEAGPEYLFREWPNPQVPDVAAGAYSVWEGTRLIYIGMSGRGLTAEDIERRQRSGAKKGALFSRLNSHASGRRSGDQFCVYVADRLVLPDLDAETIRQIGRGEASLDTLVREYIHSRLSYRFVLTRDGQTAASLERRARGGELNAGSTLLNPRF